MLIRPAWGYSMETATAGIRLVLSGVLDAYPGTKIILGHLGEGLPFYLWRINQALARNRFVTKPFREYFTEHFWITTSGFFSNPALQCCIAEIGLDRIMFRSTIRSSTTNSAWRGSTIFRSPARIARSYSAEPPSSCCAFEA